MRHMDRPIHEQLRIARKRAKISQVRMAALLGYAGDSGHANISRIERGKQAAPVELLQRWVNACGCKLAIVPRQSMDAAAADLSVADRALVARVIAVLPSLDPALRRQLAHDLDLWESESRSR